MGNLRGRYQGLFNIVRFNWHLYLIAVLTLISLLLAGAYFDQYIYRLIAFLIVLSTLISLYISYVIYDRSGLYELKWLKDNDRQEDLNVVNIHAGFDEFSAMLVAEYRPAVFHSFDFYDPLKHTEISVQRARKMYPAFEGTVAIQTSLIPLPDCSADRLFLIFAVHEIRNKTERENFFREVFRVLKPDGQVIVVEHLRDLNNFLAYNLGFFHFYSDRQWLDVFNRASLRLQTQNKFTSFVKIYTLVKNGTES